MRNMGVFWGLILILAGVLFLLDTLGLLPVNPWTIFWPLALVLLGLALLVGAFRSRGQTAEEQLAFQLKGFEEAEVKVNYGAGKLVIGGGAAPDELLNGNFGGGVEHRLLENGELARVDLRPPSAAYWNWWSKGDRSWRINLNQDIPLKLKIQTGASDLRIDLTDTQTKYLRLKTGASSNVVTLPEAAGEVRFEVEGGAGSVVIHVPDGVAARIKGDVGLGDLKVNRKRFPRAGSAYQSDDYDIAKNKVNIRVSFGAGDVKIT